jgi:hypothetical protein
MHISRGSLGHAIATEIPQGVSARELDPGERIRQNVVAARDVARSALTNERFRLMLEQIVSPSFSDALMLMKDDGGRADLRAAQQHYGESD